MYLAPAIFFNLSFFIHNTCLIFSSTFFTIPATDFTHSLFFLSTIFIHLSLIGCKGHSYHSTRTCSIYPFTSHPLQLLFYYSIARQSYNSLLPTHSSITPACHLFHKLGPFNHPFTLHHIHPPLRNQFLTSARSPIQLPSIRTSSHLPSKLYTLVHILIFLLFPFTHQFSRHSHTLFQFPFPRAQPESCRPQI